ncbi:hypothetical protein ACSYDW_08520 [Paeniglutamicibacter sp. R2-26]|uniref:hypothetical protein n=1 Tax=Paeniglutamicibacter sp. R2-26 TaxID=3144417 RepID=UPI003EE75739
MASNPEGSPGGDRPEMLVASLALIFEERTGIIPHARVRQLLTERRCLSLLATPVAWGELSVVEVAIAVNPDGYIVMADADGNTSLGQQIEGFAIALKRGTGALYADFDGVDAEGGEPVEDPRLEDMHAGRSVLLGTFPESEVAAFAGVTKTAWKYFADGDLSVAVHEGYMPEIILSRSVFPAIMLSRTGPRFSMVFWFEGQSRKLHGYPAFGHGWSVAVEPALEAAEGTPAAKATEFLKRQWSQPDTEAIAELREFGVGAEEIRRLGEALTGSGSLEAVKGVLRVFGRPANLADYLAGTPVPESAVDVAPRGFTGSMAAVMAADTREATGWKKFFNVFAWKPSKQLAWGLAEAAFFALVILLTDWNNPWIPRWLLIVIVAGGVVNSVGNSIFGLVRLLRARRAKRS